MNTNAVSDLLAGNQALHDLLEAEARHQLPAMVLGEYRFGLGGSRLQKRLEPLYDQLEHESIVLSPDSHTARHYAEIRMRLNKMGTPIPENDIWIAALAVQHKLVVASRDEHFDRVEVVQRIQWE